MAELGEAADQIKKHQNTLLDRFDPKNTHLISLLKKLVALEKELEDLDNEYQHVMKDTI